MTKTPKPREGGIQYWPTDWTAQCEAKCRKTGEQCPHTCDSQISSLLAGRTQMDEHWFSIQGRPVNLCRGHYNSWHARANRLLTLPLIDGGHLSPGNRFAYGSIIIMADRVDFEKEDGKIKVRIPPAWGWVSWRGNVPEGMLERIPHYVKPDTLLKETEGEELENHSNPGGPGYLTCCPNCGGNFVGDGYTSVRHCENADDDTYYDVEPDADTVLCKPIQY